MSDPTEPKPSASPFHFIGALLKDFVKHTFISFYRTIVHRINAAFKDMYVMQAGKKVPYKLISLSNLERSKAQLMLGILGRIIGFIIGSVCLILLVLGRMLWNTPEHVYRIFCRSVREMLPKNSAMHDFFELSKDKRAQPECGYGSSYALGILGIFPLGVLSGLVGLVVGIILRLSMYAYAYCGRRDWAEKKNESALAFAARGEERRLLQGESNEDEDDFSSTAAISQGLKTSHSLPSKPLLNVEQPAEQRMNSASTSVWMYPFSFQRRHQAAHQEHLDAESFSL